MAIVDALDDHRRRLALGPRAYALRRAWAVGFLARIMNDPVALRVRQVIEALEGTGYSLVVARLPVDPISYAGATSQPSPAGQSDGQPAEPVSRLPRTGLPVEVDDSWARCA